MKTRSEVPSDDIAGASEATASELLEFPLNPPADSFTAKGPRAESRISTTLNLDNEAVPTFCMTEYKLCASLEGHEDDVRGVAFPHPSTAITASRDATVRLWRILSQQPPKIDDTVLSSGNAFVNTVAYYPPTEGFADGLIFAGGKDTIIEVREPNKPPDSHAERLLIGHTHAVCALDTCPEGGWVVSGSWDGTARIWPVGKWECEATLEGGEGSVWGVLAYDKDTVITGGADKLIRVFKSDGTLVRTIRGHSDVVRAVCKLPDGHPSGAQFASASNDATIKLWRLDGTEVGTLHGHENFIYSLACLPNGELASTGEDRTLRIWRGGECVQTITHPAISVWAVAVCQESGDIITGASDRKARIFSRSADRHADAETTAAFDDAVKSSAIPQQQMGDINKEKLPGTEFLTTKIGKKDGQVAMIRENDGSVGAYSWSSAAHEWVQVGTVVDAAGSSGKKTTYLGKDYDYVFDVDVKDGEPALKLPYNLSQNPYEAATQFINDNELSMNYLDEVAGFITRNTQGATLGQAAPSASGPVAGSDPWGQESRYRPGGDTSSAPAVPSSRPKVLPQKQYLSIRTGNLQTIQKKIEELNVSVDSSQKLDAKQIDLLRDLTTQLGEHATSTLPSSQVISSSLNLLIELATSWPPAMRLPILDLMRLLAGASPVMAEYASPLDNGTIIDVVLANNDKERPNNVMLGLRTIANLFETEPGQKLASKSFVQIQSLAQEHIGSGNRNMSIALATLYVNYAVQNASEPDFDKASASVELLTRLLKNEKDAEALYRAAVALGTFISGDSEIRSAAKDVYGVEEALSKAEKQAKEPRIKGVASEIRDLLKQ